MARRGPIRVGIAGLGRVACRFACLMKAYFVSYRRAIVRGSAVRTKR